MTARQPLVAKPVSRHLKLQPGIEPPTIDRLLKIRSGEVVRYYRGNAADTEDEAAPNYSRLLTRVFMVARKLERESRVQLEKVDITQTITIDRGLGLDPAAIKIPLTDYIAIGLAAA
jgi:hypothetical protein